MNHFLILITAFAVMTTHLFAESAGVDEDDYLISINPAYGKSVTRQFSYVHHTHIFNSEEGWISVKYKQGFEVNVATEPKANQSASVITIKKMSFEQEIPSKGFVQKWDSDTWEVGTKYAIYAAGLLDKNLTLTRDKDNRPDEVLGINYDSKISNQMLINASCPGERLKLPTEPLKIGEKKPMKELVSDSDNEFFVGHMYHEGINKKDDNTSFFNLRLEGDIVTIGGDDSEATGRKLKGKGKELYQLDPKTGVVLFSKSEAEYLTEKKDKSGEPLELKGKVIITSQLLTDK